MASTWSQVARRHALRLHGIAIAIKKYAEYTEFWQQAIGAMIPMFNAPPKSIVDIVGNYDLKSCKAFSVIGEPLDFIRTMLNSAEDVLV